MGTWGPARTMAGPRTLALGAREPTGMRSKPMNCRTLSRVGVLSAAAALGLLTVGLQAETSAVEISAPVLGYVYDPGTQNIRVVTGVPGAATLDGTVATGATFTRAWVHSASETAVGIAKNGAVAVASWGGAVESSVLATELGTVDLVSFSRSGSYVVIAGGGVAEVWTSLGANPERVAKLSPQGGITAVAVNDSGETAVGTGAGQLLVYANGSSSVAATGTRDSRSGRRDGTVSTTGSSWNAIAYLPGGDDLVAADGTAVIKVSNASTAPSREALATLSQDVTALGVSLDGTMIVAAAGETLTMLAGGSAASVEAGFAVNGLASLSGNAVFDLLSPDSVPVTILDADSSPARVIEIPGQTNSLQLNGGLAQ